MACCAVCGHWATQKCHVKDKSHFKGGKNHDFHNIIYLCALHHHEYFDSNRLAIIPETKNLILLRCVKYRRIDVIEPKSAVVVLDDYIKWKNQRIHCFLKAELRRMLKKDNLD